MKPEGMEKVHGIVCLKVHLETVRHVGDKIPKLCLKIIDKAFELLYFMKLIFDLLKQALKIVTNLTVIAQSTVEAMHKPAENGPF